MMSAQSLASFCCSSRKRWCSCAQQPGDGSIDFGLPAPLAARQRAAHVVDAATNHHSVASMQPRYQKSALAVFSVDVLRDLPIGGLMGGQRVQAVQCALLERGDTAAVHRQHAHRRIAPEHARVASRLGRRGGASRKNATRRQVLLQQLKRRAGACVDKAGLCRVKLVHAAPSMRPCSAATGKSRNKSATCQRGPGPQRRPVI